MRGNHERQGEWGQVSRGHLLLQCSRQHQARTGTACPRRRRRGRGCSWCRRPTRTASSRGASWWAPSPSFRPSLASWRRLSPHPAGNVARSGVNKPRGPEPSAWQTKRRLLSRGLNWLCLLRPRTPNWPRSCPIQCSSPRPVLSTSSLWSAVGAKAAGQAAATVWFGVGRRRVPRPRSAAALPHPHLAFLELVRRPVLRRAAGRSSSLR